MVDKNRPKVTEFQRTDHHEVASILYDHNIKYDHMPDLKLGDSTMYPAFYLPEYQTAIHFPDFVKQPMYNSRIRDSERMYSKHNMHIVSMHPDRIVKVDDGVPTLDSSQYKDHIFKSIEAFLQTKLDGFKEKIKPKY